MKIPHQIPDFLGQEDRELKSKGNPRTPYFLATLTTSAHCAGLLDDLETAPLRLAEWHDFLNPYLTGFSILMHMLFAAVALRPHALPRWHVAKNLCAIRLMPEGELRMKVVPAVVALVFTWTIGLAAVPAQSLTYVILNFDPETGQQIPGDVTVFTAYARGDGSWGQFYSMMSGKPRSYIKDTNAEGTVSVHYDGLTKTKTTYFPGQEKNTAPLLLPTFERFKDISGERGPQPSNRIILGYRTQLFLSDEEANWAIPELGYVTGRRKIFAEGKLIQTWDAVSVLLGEPDWLVIDPSVPEVSPLEREELRAALRPGSPSPDDWSECSRKNMLRIDEQYRKWWQSYLADQVIETTTPAVAAPRN